MLDWSVWMQMVKFNPEYAQPKRQEHVLKGTENKQSVAVTGKPEKRRYKKTWSNKELQPTHNHKLKNILTGANHIDFGNKYLLDRDDTFERVVCVCYWTGTAVYCLVAICLVAIYDHASRVSRRILGRLAWNWRRGLLSQRLMIIPRTIGSSILAMSRFHATT